MTPTEAENTAGGGLFGEVEAPVIREIRPLRGRAGLVSLRVGRRAVVRLRESTAARLGVHVGQAWTASLAVRLANAARVDAAAVDAERYLARRARSERAVRERLSSKGHAPDAIDGAIRRLRESGAIDDRALAEDLAREAWRKGPVSRAAMRARAERVGVPEGAADEALRAAGSADDAAAAVDLARECLRRVSAGGDVSSAARRTLAALARRGFEEDVSLEAVRTAMRERGWEAPEA